MTPIRPHYAVRPFHLQQCADEVFRLVAGLRGAVGDLTGGGQWRSPVATAFQGQAWAPIESTLKGLATALEQTANSLMRAARALEDAQSERRRAEALAVGAGVGVALTVLTFGISDVAAAEAAAGAAALMARAATVAAGALRVVLLDLEEAGAAIRVASVTMRTWGTRVAGSAAVTLPALTEGPLACQEAAPELIDRLMFDPKVKDASTFFDVGTAQRAIQSAIDAQQVRIRRWLETDTSLFLDPPIKFDTSGDVGRVLTRSEWARGEAPRYTTSLRVVLRRSGLSPTGFVVYTAFPVLRK